jgi:hypothetical protein
MCQTKPKKINGNTLKGKRKKEKRSNVGMWYVICGILCVDVDMLVW